ncbi:hypothetical protein [Pandoraea apista]|uniref:hypothetical protein n=1 Tax=Pandoraea apista TaxID=93218 RepID=UPI000F672569|nr:hypothetical protein [Pandoraea apista]RRW90613.1 hypothetical protein EGJ54_21925 [Pandoraea apista]RRX00405.1 hypothetical protein EGJ56_19170 [Pandoraea apista]
MDIIASIAAIKLDAAEAARLGLPMCANPYPTQTDAHHLWADAYRLTLVSCPEKRILRPE